MNIVFNTRFLLNNYLEGYGHFLHEILTRLSSSHPEHQFIFLFDRPFDQKFVFNKNVIPVIVSPETRHPLLWKYWFDIRVPSILRKYKAEIFISCDGFCSLRTRTPQLLVVHDLAFIHHPTYVKRSHLFFYKKYTPAFLRKAKRIITVSEFSKKDISSVYNVDLNKISVIGNAARDIFQPIDDDQRSATLEKYSSGKNYFLYTGSIHPRKNLINLLKAFSIFKKRQKTEFKLVLAGRQAWKNEEFSKSLASYKYRNDVVMTGYLEETELAKLMASAYALVYPSVFEGFGVPVLEAMACDVPVITSSNTAMEEVAGDAALYADPLDPASIAENMMLLYKDESLRSRLIENGKKVRMKYDWDQSAKLFWNEIEAVLANASVPA